MALGPVARLLPHGKRPRPGRQPKGGMRRMLVSKRRLPPGTAAATTCAADVMPENATRHAADSALGPRAARPPNLNPDGLAWTRIYIYMYEGNGAGLTCTSGTVLKARVASQAAPCKAPGSQASGRSHVLLKGTSSDIDMLENISARCGAHGGSTHNSPTPWCRTRRAPYTSCQWYWQRAYRRQV
jgi:hypothetical protein